MIRIRRRNLPAELQSQLNQFQQAIDQNTTHATTWDDFCKTETYSSLRAEVYDVFHNKCAYCESAEPSAIEHHWPKSPHPHNGGRGTTSRMFQWQNMLLACSVCNGFGGKASHMQWETDGSPTLLNPCEDEPLCYLRITLESTPQFAIGWIDPMPSLKPEARSRAEYTIRRLKLNTRDALVRGRARTRDYFLGYAYLILEFGPDYETAPGVRLRETFLKMLDAREPYLSPIRQVLYYEPDFRDLYVRLLAVVPEMASVLATWALPSLDCAALKHDPSLSDP